MALSDELSKLAVRAQEAAKRSGTATEMAKSDLEANRDFARARGEEQAEDLRAVADKGQEQISDAWKEMQISWNHATAALREDVESRKAEHDLRKAQRRADRAEEDARFAINFAYSAIAEAEYSVLDAELARMDADEQSKEGDKEAGARI
jgi:hypothetical protein